MTTGSSRYFFTLNSDLRFEWLYVVWIIVCVCVTHAMIQSCRACFLNNLFVNKWHWRYARCWLRRSWHSRNKMSITNSRRHPQFSIWCSLRHTFPAEEQTDQPTTLDASAACTQLTPATQTIIRWPTKWLWRGAKDPLDVRTEQR